MKSPALLCVPCALALLAVACEGEPDRRPVGSADGGADPTVDPDAGATEIPRIDPAACRYDISLPQSEGVDYECGDLVTYERRAAKSGVIRVHFVRFFSGTDSSNATLYLEGGPGGNGSGMVRRLELFGSEFLAGLMVDGDFLVIAQRGTSLSKPSLECDEQDCDLGDAFLPAYNTASNADDIDELRALLGYDQLNVYGISYGSRLALEYLRRHGDRARSAILGGLVPAHIVWPAEIPASFYGALTALDDSCAADGACSAAFGDLKADFEAGVAALNSDPVELDGGNIYLDGDTYAAFLFRIMYARSSYPWLPLVISDLATRRTDRIEEFLVPLLYSLSSSNVARGMYYSVVCGEMFNPPDAAAFESANTEVPEAVKAVYSYNWYSLLDVCASWPVGDLQKPLSKPVQSSVPSFVASGSIDPITPPRFGDAAAAHLPNSVVVTYENSGHGATLQTPCGRETFMAFLADPSTPPDTGCAAEIATEYEMPDAATAGPLPLELIGLEAAQAPPLPLQATGGRRL